MGLFVSTKLHELDTAGLIRIEPGPCESNCQALWSGDWLKLHGEAAADVNPCELLSELEFVGEFGVEEGRYQL